MKIIFLFIILLIILFFPFPILFEASYDKEFKIYLYKKFKIALKNSPEKEIRTRKKSNKAKIKLNFKSILDSLQTNRFKPLLNLSINMQYSLADAALTAISYGAIYGVLQGIYLELITIFNIKKKNYDISPLFNDETSISFSIKGIIYLSIANIIYIAFLYFYKERHI